MSTEVTICSDKCPVCGHPKSKFFCGSPSVAVVDAGKYICFCPPALRMPSSADFGEALADLVKAINNLKTNA